MLAAGLGLALQSGATSSLIYELLHKEGLHESFQKVYGRASAYFLVAGIIAAPFGSFMYSRYPQLPYVFAFFVLLASAMTVFFVRWEFTKKPPAFSTYVQTIKDGTHVAIRNKVLMGVVVIGVGLTLNRMFFNQNINQPYLISVGVSVASIGIVAAVVSALQAFVSLYAYKISARFSKGVSLLFVTCVPAMSMIVLGFMNSLLAIPIILLFSMGHAFRDPVMVHITQDELEKDKRATMASTTSFLMSISVGLLLPFFGHRIDVFGMRNTMMLVGILTLAVGGIGLLVITQRRRS